MGVAVGIDLGTTNTVVGVVREGRALTLADEGGRRLIPSVVSFHPTGKVLVGELAKERRMVDPQNTIYSVKRLIGRTWDMEEVQRARRALPFELVEGPKQGVAVVARGETYMLPEISAFVLRRAKAIAESAIGETVDRAVITVPANFNDLQRAATKLAGKLAGLEVLRILNEPTAAALAYGQASGQAERIAVYDLGGGTFDITLLDLSGNVFEVLATGGDTALGGDDIDQLIAEQMTQFFLKTYRVDPRSDPLARASLRARAEVLKVALSSKDESAIELNDIARGEGGAFIPASFSMRRADLERIALPLIDRTLETCRFSIETIGLRVEEIQRVILVGGSTRMPLVVSKVESYFKKPATGRVNPDEVVALGAAIQAAALTRTTRSRSVRPPASAEATARPGSNPHASLDDASTIVGGLGALPVVGSPALPAGARTEGLPASVPPVLRPRFSPPPPPPPDSSEQEDQVKLASVPAPRMPAEFDAELELPRAPALPNVGPVKRPPPLPRLPSSREPVAPETSPSVRSAIARPVTAAPPATAQTTRFTQRTGLRSSPPSASPESTLSRRPAPLLIDVTPISLGVETAGGFCDFLISANTPVPCDRTRVFLTASDGQTSVIVKVAQGESKRFGENTLLGDLHLTGLTGAARGEVRVAVTFEIDVDGILNVRAKDEGSGRETYARMHMVGTQSDAGDVASMLARQTRSEIG
jgi:molecular chaperone DnaK